MEKQENSIMPSNDEKTECTLCAKLISKKNISAHNKTASHLSKITSSIVKESEPKIEKEDVKPKEKEHDADNKQLKVKAEFNAINEKLDYLTSLVTELCEELLFEDEDVEEEPLQLNKN